MQVYRSVFGQLKKDACLIQTIVVKKPIVNLEKIKSLWWVAGSTWSSGLK